MLQRETVVVYHLLGKADWSTVIVNGTRQITNGNFHGMRSFHYHNFFPDGYGSKEIQAKRPGSSKPANGTHIFHLSRTVFRIFLARENCKQPVSYIIFVDFDNKYDNISGATFPCTFSSPDSSAFRRGKAERGA